MQAMNTEQMARREELVGKAALIASVGGTGATPTGPTRTTGCGGSWPSSSPWPG
jgi:hypothetical protein